MSRTEGDLGLLLSFALTTLVVPIYLLSQVEASTEPALVLDRLALTLVLIISLIGSIICIYALKYMDQDKAQPRFFLFMLLFLGAMTGAVMSNELIVAVLLLGGDDALLLHPDRS